MPLFPNCYTSMLYLIIRLLSVFNYDVNNHREVTAVFEEASMKTGTGTGTGLSPKRSGFSFNT